MFDLRETREGDVTVVRVSWGTGVLRWGEGMLAKTVRNLVARGQKRVVLDVEEVPSFDSRDVGELAECIAHASRGGGEIRLRGVGPKHRAVLDAARLTSVLVIEPD